MEHEFEQILLNVFQGDRYTALKSLQAYVQQHPNDTQALWYLAYATDDLEERHQVLEKVKHAGKPPELAQLATRFLRNEDSLVLPPSAWELRWERIKRNKWRIGASVIALILLSFLALLTWQALDYQNEQQQVAIQATNAALASPTPRPTATATPLPLQAGADVAYEAGTLRILRLERPTNRVIINGGYDPTVAEPMPGTEFAALQFEFVCNQGNCRAAPEAGVALRLSSNEIATLSSNMPLVADGEYQMACGRGTTCSGWLVFEVPRHDRIDAVLVSPAGADYNAPPLEIDVSFIR